MVTEEESVAFSMSPAIMPSITPTRSLKGRLEKKLFFFIE